MLAASLADHDKEVMEAITTRMNGKYFFDNLKTHKERKNVSILSQTNAS